MFGTEICKGMVSSPQNRGAIRVDDTMLINSRSYLVYHQTGFDMSLFSKPIVYVGNKPNIYKLGDLSIPYQISKFPNSDTIFVNKDGWVLKFILFN
jgi:hypothetical protein